MRLGQRATETWRASAIGRWHAGLPSNERRLVDIAALLFAFVVLYVGIWQPVVDFRDGEVIRYQNERAGLAWMRANESNARSRTSAPSSGGDVNIANVSASARRFGIPLQRVQSLPAGGISVQLQAQPFDDILRLLDVLNREHGLRVVSASVDAESSGRVNARFSIK